MVISIPHLMVLDAICLAVIFGALFLRVFEDQSFDWFERAAYTLIALSALRQALWLLGYWTPGPAGYPQDRLFLDVALALIFGRRAVEVLIRKARERQRSSRRLLTALRFWH